jgi:hypothetical protein
MELLRGLRNDELARELRKWRRREEIIARLLKTTYGNNLSYCY